MISRWKAIAKNTSVRSQKTILVRSKEVHVFDDSPPDLAVMPLVSFMNAHCEWKLFHLHLILA